MTALKRRSGILGIALLLLGTGAHDITAQFGGVLGRRSTVYTYVGEETSLESASIRIRIRGAFLGTLDATVLFDVNDDGVFATNEVGVDGVPFFAEEALPRSFAVDFSDPQQLRDLVGDTSNRVRVRVILRDEVGTVVDAADQRARKVAWETDQIFTPEPGFVGGSGASASMSAHVSGDERTIVQAAGQAAFNQGVPDLPPRKGKPNECVPISLANSLFWLAAKHGFADKIPKRTGDLLDELGQAVGYTASGTRPQDILPGKQSFTNDRSLPLENKQIDATLAEGRSDIVDKILAELKAGEDVELIMDLKESPTSTPTGSHAVTVVGAQTRGNKQYVTVHDPVTPRGDDHYEVLRNGQLKGYPLGKAFGVFIISESFRQPT